MGILGHALPMLGGYVMKLLAVIISRKQQQQQTLIESLNKQASNQRSLYNASQKETPAAAWNRRFIILVVMGFIAFYIVSGIYFPTVIEIAKDGYSLFGIIPITPDSIEHKSLTGVIAYKEVFQAFMLIIEFYMGGQLAKAN